jgi:hypothetical protein
MYAPLLSKTEVIARAESLAERFLFSFWKGKAYTKLISMNFDMVYEHLIYPEYGILLVEDEDLGQDGTGKQILGKYDPESNTAYVDRTMRNDPRRVFTCWHEVGGHGVLQGEWLRQHVVQRRGSSVTSTDESLSMRTINVLERQANLFAAHAAIPSKLLAAVILEVFDPYRPIVYRGPGQYTFTVNGRVRRRLVGDFAHFAWITASFLQHRFGWISVQAISYRLLQTPLLENAVQSRLEMHRAGSLGQDRLQAHGVRLTEDLRKTLYSVN